MPKEAEFSTRTRLVYLIRALIENPKRYTVRQLADKYGKSQDTIRDDIEAIRNGGFAVEYDDLYRYYFVVDKPFRQL